MSRKSEMQRFTRWRFSQSWPSSKRRKTRKCRKLRKTTLSSSLSCEKNFVSKRRLRLRSTMTKSKHLTKNVSTWKTSFKSRRKRSLWTARTSNASSNSYWSWRRFKTIRRKLSGIRSCTRSNLNLESSPLSPTCWSRRLIMTSRKKTRSLTLN